MAYLTEISKKLVIDSELSETSENPVQNKVVNKAISRLGEDINGLFIPKTISMTNPNVSGQTEFKRQLRFNTGKIGTIEILLRLTLSRTCTLTILLDGEEVKTQSYSASNNQVHIVCSGVPSGVHIAEVKVVGSSFTASNILFSASGNIVISDEDMFIEGFPSNSGYISVCLGRLETYSFANSKGTLVNTVYGIKKSRTFESNGTHLACITETGSACLILNALSAEFTNVDIVSGAKAISVLAKTQTNWDIFVLTEDGYINSYNYNVDSSTLTNTNSVQGAFDDIVAFGSDDKTYLLCAENGDIYLLEGLSVENKTYIDTGVNLVIAQNDTNTLNITYTKNQSAHMAEITLNPFNISLKGRQGYCDQKIVFNGNWLQLNQRDISYIEG